jgi:hypothetical protein
MTSPVTRCTGLVDAGIPSGVSSRAGLIYSGVPALISHRAGLIDAGVTTSISGCTGLVDAGISASISSRAGLIDAAITGVCRAGWHHEHDTNNQNKKRHNNGVFESMCVHLVSPFVVNLGYYLS